MTLDWEFVPAETSTEELPQTQAILIVNGERLTIGTYAGAQFVTPAQGEGRGMEPALTSAGTWFAGGGDELYVYQEGNEIVVKHRTLDEVAGDGQPREVLRHVP